MNAAEEVREPQTAPTCSHCGFPLPKHGGGVRHYGTHAAHQESECLRLLHAEIARLRERADMYQWLRGDVPHHSVRWPRWEVRNWDGRTWQTLSSDALDGALRRDMGGERPNVAGNRLAR